MSPETISLNRTYPASIPQYFGKRLFDICGACFALIFLLPVIGIIAAIIKLESDGPAFYRGTRCGLGGKIFRIWKFRSMVPNADKIGGPSTSVDDPRITRSGHFIRKYKLDEFPQLFNVLVGEMSFVGPRPEVPQEVELYDDEQRQLLAVRPGITDYASIRFRNEGEILKGAKDPHQAYKELIQPEKLKLGLEYVRNASLLTDIKIISMTVKVVILGN